MPTRYRPRPCRHAPAERETGGVCGHLGLFARHTEAEPTISSADMRMTTTGAVAWRKTYLTAHHACAWYRECAEPPLLPDRARNIPDTPVRTRPSWPRPPREDQLHALLSDAAAQARSYLLSGTTLESAWDDDAIRLASVIPRTSIPETAERLGLDIAKLHSAARVTDATAGIDSRDGWRSLRA